MKKVFFGLTLFVIVNITHAQVDNDPLLDYVTVTDSTFNDTTQQWEVNTYFRLYDTTGTVASGNYQVTVSTFDSVGLVLRLFNKAQSNYTRVAEAESVRLASLRAANIYRSKATELVGTDNYVAYTANMLRPALAGTWAFRYAGELQILSADANGVFRDDQNNIVLAAFPFAPNMIRFTRVDPGGNEPIFFYQLPDGRWLGEDNHTLEALKRLLYIALLLLLDLAAVSQDEPALPFIWGNLNVEAIYQDNALRARAGIRWDTEGKMYFTLKEGFRIFQDDATELWLYPFWFKYSFEDEGYNTPISLEYIFIKHQYFEISAMVDFYGGWQYMPSISVVVIPFQKNE